MEFEKVCKSIAEVLSVDPAEITPETTFLEDLGADYTISESELKEYLQKVKAAGLTNDGAYVSTAIGTMVWMFRNLYGIMNNSFYEGEDGFIWTPLGQREQWIKLITTMREWYKEGLIDPDFAVVNDAYDARKRTI